MMAIKTPQGFLPFSKEDWEKAAKVKTGTHMRLTYTQMRNALFFKKWWALAEIAYGAWQEYVNPVEYKGQRVQPNFERFRRDLIILSGYFYPVFNVKGELRLEAKSIAWANMQEEDFEKLYSASINAVLQKILPQGVFSDESLRSTVDRVLGFA